MQGGMCHVFSQQQAVQEESDKQLLHRVPKGHTAENCPSPDRVCMECKWENYPHQLK